MNIVYRRGQKSGLLPRTGDGNPVAFVTRSSKSNYKAVIITPEQAFRIMVELGEPYRTLVFLVAVTGLRISEALGLKWSDLGYERQMIHLCRVWVGNELIPRLKTDGSEAPVPLGELLADVLQSWHRNTLYAKPEDWIFPSTKMKGRTPLSASTMAKDKIRPAAIKVGILIEPGQQFGFHNVRHSLATFLINKSKDLKTIQGLLRHAKSSTTLDLYSQAIDESELAAQGDIALAITSNQVELDHWRIVVLDNYSKDLTADQLSALTALDAKLAWLTTSGNEHWTDQAVWESSGWREIRELATGALNKFGWPIETPPSYSHEYVGPWEDNSQN